MRALVLAGGGAKGSYQIGAYKALQERGEHFDIITGTSVGALNGALIAQGDWEKAHELWYNLTPEQVVSGDTTLLDKLVNMDINPKEYRKVMHYLRDVIGQKGLDISPLETLIKTLLDEERLRSSASRFGMVTVSLKDVKPIEIAIDDIPEGEVARYLLSSANLPIFKMEPKEGKLFIDGGFYDNLPLALAKRMGATEFTTIELGAIGMRRIPKGVEFRSIAPRVDLGLMLAFSSTQMRKNLQLGYLDALKVMDRLMGRHVYIVDNLENERFMQSLISLDEEALSQLATVLGFEGMDPRRFTFEKLLPKLSELLGFDENASYKDMLVGLLEAISEELPIERMEVKSLSQWIGEVRSHYKPGKALGEQLSLLDKLFLQTQVFGQQQRIALLQTVYEKLLYEVSV